jgi:hypothetical protein
MNKFAPFVEWLWSKRDVPYSFRITVLTEAALRDDPSVPRPPLSNVEAESLFKLLAEMKLVFFKDGPDPSYLLNHVEAHRWLALIKDLKKPDWLRSWWFSKLSKSIWFIVGGLIGGFVGGYAGTMGKKVAESRLQDVHDAPVVLPASAGGFPGAAARPEREQDDGGS